MAGRSDPAGWARQSRRDWPRNAAQSELADHAAQKPGMSPASLIFRIPAAIEKRAKSQFPCRL